MRFSFAQLLSLLAFVGGSFFTRPAHAQTSPTAYSYQLVTTIESVIPSGFGRSIMLFTPVLKSVTNKTIKDTPLEHLFSLTGINLDNIQKNDTSIKGVMERLNNEGYEFVQALPLTSSLEKNGIFMTRYVFRKAKYTRHEEGCASRT